ncbi:type VII secretion-associated protein [Mycolicibacter sinensis]|uniref:Type VII secretion-associated protein n=1 Tax=Mycolicibacter sinensis (strain JDM601) TaxID=875328 RepID=A0A1A2P113_MYCSD|nr:type VII secretion-associated protein [Mycolicibacter sinensis]OBH21006.1 type VII secretion-associated protein [Mycolicibacter sinensis]OBI31716.1 type VII secretion-associated protein [Mycolicibacter sinensis]
MTHCAVIEVGPATVHRLCCGASEAVDAAAALEWIDEPIALVDGEPVEVPQLLRSVLACPEPTESMEIIHPSWWPARRVQRVTAAARGLAEDIVTRPRSAVLSNAFQATAVVEIAEQLVAITVAGITAEPRVGAPGEVAAAVADRVLAGVPHSGATVVIDAPAGIGGAGALAALIADRLRGAAQVAVVDELPAERAGEPAATPEPASAMAQPERSRARRSLALAAALAVVGLALRAHHDAPSEPATYLVEGRVAVQVPADWSVRRVTAGPGSARVEVASPIDPRLVLHITQAPAAGETLAAIAEPLHRAMQVADADAPGVFVGFDPAGSSAGRPAVTYREIRDDHHVDWAVLVDRAVRIGIGCQSGPEGADALRPVCEQAVRSAHAVT